MDFFNNRNHDQDYQDVYHKHEGSLGHEGKMIDAQRLQDNLI